MVSLAERMKNNYENRYRFFLTRRTPVIIRLDGKAFHTFMKGRMKPYDEMFMMSMDDTALFLVEKIQGAKLAYTQSDEISILITDYDHFNTEAWFDYNLQKIVSIASGYASAYFSRAEQLDVPVVFDARAFNVPHHEVCNYFVSRQRDWKKNSIQMLARKLYSHKELKGCNIDKMKEMIRAKGWDWDKEPPRHRFGSVWLNRPGEDWHKYTEFVFTQPDYRGLVERVLEPEEK